MYFKIKLISTFETVEADFSIKNPLKLKSNVKKKMTVSDSKHYLESRLILWMFITEHYFFHNGYCHKLQMYGTQWVVNAECCNETVVYNALGEMWSVCIMASIWRNNPEVIISSPRKGER